MKKLVYLSVLFGALVFATPSNAQINISINFGSAPQWGPSGYDQAQYYYMPEYDMYYDVRNSHYVWWESNKWKSRAYLPQRYSNVNLYNTYKVVINDKEPWRKHNNNQKKYYSYANNHKQVSLRDARLAEKEYSNTRIKADEINNRQNNRINASRSENGMRGDNSSRR